MIKRVGIFLLCAIGMAATASEVAFLGVMTRPNSVQNISGPDDLGLTVENVVPGSPAGLMLKSGDVLKKLNDQLLITSEQLAGLVRIRKPGDSVVLTVQRGVDELAVELNLGSRPQELAQPEPTPVRPPLPSQPAFPGFGQGIPFGGFDARFRQMEEEMQRMQQQLMQMPGGGSSVSSGRVTRQMQWQEGDTSVRYTEEDGNASLHIQEGDDEVFHGPVNTDDEWKQVPQTYRTMLENRGVGPIDQGIRL